MTKVHVTYEFEMTPLMESVDFGELQNILEKGRNGITINMKGRDWLVESMNQERTIGGEMMTCDIRLLEAKLNGRRGLNY